MPVLATLLLAAVVGRLGFRPTGDGSRLPTDVDVVLVTLSSARPELLDPRGRAPALAAFASSAIPFSGFVTQGTSTLPGLASVMTGLAPVRHGLDDRSRRVAHGVPLLAEVLGGAGFASASFVGEYGLQGTGLERGFDRSLSQRDDRAAVERALEWVRGLGKDERLLLHVHLGGLSVPYAGSGADPGYRGPLAGVALDQRWTETTEYGRWHPPGGTDGVSAPVVELAPEDVQHVRRRWLAQVPATDAAFAALLAGVEDAGRRRALWIAAGVHGEGLGERGFFGPGYGPYEELIRTPAAVRLPDDAVTVSRVDALVDAVDLFPTVVDVLGLPAVAGLDGRSLVPLIEGWQVEPLAPLHVVGGSGTMAVRAERWKLVRRDPLSGSGEARTWELYNLEEDPGERWNLYRQETPLGPVGRSLRAALEAEASRPGPGARPAAGPRAGGAAEASGGAHR